MLKLKQLRAYQRAGIRWMVAHTFGAITLRMGFGKTAIAAIAAGRMMKRGTVRQVLVVGTKNVVEMTWPDELRDWKWLHQFTFATVSQSLAMRTAHVEMKPDFLLVSYDHLKWFMDRYYGTEYMPDMLILDESTALKNYSTKRSKALRKRIHVFKRRFMLTATPTPESPGDIYPQLCCIDPDKRGMGKDITAFRARFCNQVTQGDNRYGYQVHEFGVEEIIKRMAPITFNLEAEKHIEGFREAQVVDVPVGWKPEHRALYDEMEANMVMRFYDELGEQKRIDAVNAGVMRNKLRQMCSGVIYERKLVDGRMQSVPIGLDTEKLEALDEVLETLGKRQSLIFYEYKWERAEILKRLGKSARPLKSKKDLDDFRAGRFQRLVLHPASAGHGLNLHHNCSDAIFFTICWSSERYQQSIGRLRAHLNAQQVMIYRLMRRGPSADWDTAAKVEGKILTEKDYINRVGYRHIGKEANGAGRTHHPRRPGRRR